MDRRTFPTNAVPDGSCFAVAPLLGVMATKPNPTMGSAAWDAAVAAEKSARTAYEAYQREAGDAYTDEAFNDLVAKHCKAVDVLMTTPAPSLDAVCEKMQVAAETDLFSDFEEAGTAILADLRHLTGAVA